ncbi:MAG: histidine phosphatase family protein [Rhodoglobus sp.]|nr:histidine phosphatase family protein [Rhodoglobus sp.]
MLLYLVRHGETDWNLTHRIQGSTDVPLNDTGRQQARTTGRLLARRQWDAIIASPLSRAVETASIIAEEVGLPTPTTLDAIVERNYGEAEGLSDPEIRERFPDETPVPGRESREEVVARVMPALMGIAEEHPGESVLVVSHGGVIRSILNAVDPDNRHGLITNGSIHSFSHEHGSFALIAFDDPIEVESLGLATEDIEAQNAVERRDSAASR